MKVKVDKDLFLQAINQCSAVQPKNPTYQNFLCILLFAENETLTLTAMSVSTSATYTIPARVSEPGYCLPDLKTIQSGIKKMPKGELALGFDAKNSEFKVKGGKFNFKQQSLHSDENFKFPEVGAIAPINIPVTTLTTGLGVVVASAEDPSNPILSAIQIKQSDGSITFTACDGASAAQVTLRVSCVGNFEILLLNKTANILLNYLKNLKDPVDAEAQIYLKAEDQKIIFRHGGFSISANLLHDNYPSISDLIPKNFKHSLIFDKKQLINDIECVSVTTEDKNRIIKFDPVDGKLTLYCASTGSSGKANLDIPVSDGFPQIGFSIGHLLQGLKLIQSPNKLVLFSCNGSEEPTTLTPLEGDKLTYLLMPVQIRQ